jgi:hypothetical protein
LLRCDHLELRLLIKFMDDRLHQLNACRAVFGDLDSPS